MTKLKYRMIRLLSWTPLLTYIIYRCFDGHEYQYWLGIFHCFFLGMASAYIISYFRMRDDYFGLDEHREIEMYRMIKEMTKLEQDCFHLRCKLKEQQGNNNT